MSTCTAGGCDQSVVMERRDGLCGFHGKVADGLITGYWSLRRQWVALTLRCRGFDPARTEERKGIAA